jgi:GntR family transcriptional regulator, transcriptional repressor for pyruvate dehydrogenase complex
MAPTETAAAGDRTGLFRPIESRRTFEEAVEQIVAAVRSGDLRVGERLPSERKLSAVLGISRPSLREALKVCADAGIIRVTPGSNGGIVVVSDVTPPDLIRRRVGDRINEVASVLEARRLLEPQVAQLAAVYGTEEDFRKLKECIRIQRAHAHDRARFELAEERFHLSMARATGNATIVEMIRDLLRRLPIASDMDYRQPDDPQRGIEMHERTIAAVMSRDPDRIAEAMDEHLGLLEHLWEQETGRPRLRRSALWQLTGRLVPET